MLSLTLKQIVKDNKEFKGKIVIIKLHKDKFHRKVICNVNNCIQEVIYKYDEKSNKWGII
jgi:hypothetical protein